MIERTKMKSASPKFKWQPKAGWGVPVAWLTLCVVWSSTWLVIKIGLRDLPPISYAGIRFLVAIIVLFAVSVGRVGLLPRRCSDYLLLAFTGVLMFALNYGLLFWGELHVSSGLAAVLQATIPIFGMVFAHLMLPEEPLQLPKLLGALLAVGGVAIICERLLGFKRLDGVLGRARHHTRSGRRGVFERLAQSARGPTGASDDCCLANDFRRSAVAL